MSHGPASGALGALLTLAILGTPSPGAAASESPGEFAAFDRPRPGTATPAPATRSGPQPREEWERLTRTPQSFGPPRLGADELRLLDAARGARLAEIKELLKRPRLDVNTRDERGGGVLALVARQGDEALVRDLIGRGADLEQVADDGFTPLGAAAFFGRVGALKVLLKAGADPLRPGASGQPPLHLAAMAGRDAAIRALLAHGVPAGLLNRARESALDLAAERGHLDTMQLFLDAGVDPANAGR